MEKREISPIVEKLLQQVGNATRRTNYYFAHKTLPYFAHKNTSQLLDTLNSKDRQMYLLNIWNETAKIFNTVERIEVDQLPISIKSLSKDDKDFRIFIIELPQPKYQSEVYYVSFVF